jgi:serine/threonine-protein kinase
MTSTPNASPAAGPGAAELPSAALPAQIGGHRVLRTLGEGGMGRVHLCEDAGLERQVAIKVLLTATAAAQARFLREARALARVQSPHVVQIHAVGEDEGVGPWLVMELLEGEDLQARLLRLGALLPEQVTTIANDTLAGLAAAHAKGIIHRDIKPANLFVDRNGRVKITDFGLARHTATAGVGDSVPPGCDSGALWPAGGGVTQQGMVVGTPTYLAPELVRGQQPGPASDLYSLGATLYHLLAGRPPFLGHAALEVLASAVRDEAPHLTTLVEVPAGLARFIHALLHKDPALRPADAASALALLESCLVADAPPPAATRPSLPPLAPGATPEPQRTQALFALAPATGAGGSRPAPDDDDDVLAAARTAAPPPATTPAPHATSLVPAAPVASGGFSLPPTTGSSGGGFDEPSTGGLLAPGAPKVTTATLAVMMTDIAGYTERTSRQSREEAARWLALHDNLLTRVFRAFGGKVIKTIGDAFLVTFQSPTDAVHCGMAIQDRLFLHNKTATAQDAIAVRVALSVGEVRLRGAIGRGGDVFGEPVNLAARLEGVAEPGEVLFTDAVFATMNQAEVTAEQAGVHTFKGIARPVTAFRATPVPGFDPAGATPPFAGRFLARVADDKGGAGQQVGAALQAAAETGARLQTGMVRGVVEGGSIVRRLLDNPRGRRLAAAAAVVVAVVVVAVATGDNRVRRIERGEAEAVKAEVLKMPESARSVNDLVVLGRAQLASQQKKAGFRTLQTAIDKGGARDDVLALALASLSEGDAEVLDLLAAWPDKSVERKLRPFLDNASWWPRHRALDVLDKRSALSDAERMAVGLLDVEDSDCGRRKYGLGLLKRSGSGAKALAAVKTLGADMPANLCLTFDLKSAEDAIKKRSAAP